MTATQRDVERIARDILSQHALDASVLAVELVDSTWRITVTDAGGRIVTTEIAAGKPAEIRAALARWLDSYV